MHMNSKWGCEVADEKRTLLSSSSKVIERLVSISLLRWQSLTNFQEFKDTQIIRRFWCIQKASSTVIMKLGSAWEDCDRRFLIERSREEATSSRLLFPEPSWQVHEGKTHLVQKISWLSSQSLQEGDEFSRKQAQDSLITSRVSSSFRKTVLVHEPSKQDSITLGRTWLLKYYSHETRNKIIIKIIVIISSIKMSVTIECVIQENWVSPWLEFQDLL